MRADLYEGTANFHAIERLTGNAAGGDAHRRLSRRGAAAAAIIADAVFRVIGDISVTGAVLVANFAVIL